MDGLVLCLDAGNGRSYGGSGTTWYDLSGNGNNGSIDNSIGFSNINGGGLDFDGTDEIISLPKIITTTDFTVCQFVKPYSDTGEGWMFEQYNYGSGRLIFNTINSTRQIRFFIGGNYIISNFQYSSSPNQDYFFCISRNSSTGNIYVNGELDKTGTLNNTAIDNTIAAIGGSTVFTGGKQFIGRIYTTYIYNRALTPDEIKQNFNATRGRFGL